MHYRLLALTTALAAFSLSGCLDELERGEEPDDAREVEHVEARVSRSGERSVSTRG